MAKKKIVYCRCMVRFDKEIDCILVIHTGKGLYVFWHEKLISKESSEQAISPSNEGKKTTNNEKNKQSSEPFLSNEQQLTFLTLSHKQHIVCNFEDIILNHVLSASWINIPEKEKKGLHS
jgi:GH18 family chitinase